ncbi:hypothetical protein GCM10009862_00060 [Microbacterium binotii]|uniref:ABC transporter domain-containing protein n=1 Tax=Microbacterium binotii TaxID=462710 RepID=A0ABN3P4L4_9MICO
MSTPHDDPAPSTEGDPTPYDETITEVVPVAHRADGPSSPAPTSSASDEPVTEVVRDSVLAAEVLPASRRDQRQRPRFLGRALGRGNAATSAPSAIVLTGGAAATRERLEFAEAQLAAGALAAPAQLDARLISAWFGEHQVLQDVSLTMPAGRITALIGPSGCGKSTFLRILNRMHELVPSASLAGEVLLDGDDIYEPTLPVVDARKRIGMVFQKPNPFPAMSIYDNVLAGLALTGIRADRERKDYLVETCLTKAGLWSELKDRLRSPGGGLSGGQQQRLCIARSLAVRPRVLLMDEPCSALDPTSTRVIEETMLELAQEVTIVIVTHNMQQAQRVSDQCAFFLASQGQPGHIVEHGETEAMFADPLDPRTFDYVNGRFG